MLKYKRLKSVLLAVAGLVIPLVAISQAAFAVTPSPTLITPAATTTYGSQIPINFNLPVTPLLNSVLLIFAGTTTYTVTLNTSLSGSTSFTLNNSNLASNAQVLSVSPAVTKIPDGTYTVMLSYQDQASDPAAVSSVANVSLLTSAFYATAFSPAASATNVAVSSPLVITFNRPVLVDTGSIIIRRVSDNSTFATIPVTSGQVVTSGLNATITPATALEPSTAYSVSFPAFGFQDLYGNVNAGTGWQFTTAAAPVTTTGSGAATTTPQLTNTGFNTAVTSGAAIALIAAAFFVRFYRHKLATQK